MSIKKFAFIDALRGIAVLGVLLVHSAQLTDNLSTWLRDVTLQGARGVQLFFILSALTLFLSMKNRAGTDSGMATTTFFVRRFFRIAPLFYLAAILYSLKEILFREFSIGDTQPFDPVNFTSTFLFLTNEVNPYWINRIVPGGWSITVEMTFYFFVPYLFKKITSLRKAVLWTVAAFAIGLIADAIAQSLLSPHVDSLYLRDYLFFWFPNQITIFCLGIVVYMLLTKSNPVLSGPLINKMISTAGLVLTGMAAIALSLTEIPNSINHVLYSLLFVLLVLILSKHPFNALVNKLTVFLGKISFSMYITHFVILEFVSYFVRHIIKNPFAPTINFILVFALTLTITAIVSAMTYRYIEQPFIRIGESVNQRLKRKMDRSVPKNTVQLSSKI